MSIDQKTSNISIIIPTLDEAATIGGLLANLRPISGVELLVVDGGSCDSTVALAESSGAKVLKSEPGRGVQMNVGAQEARGPILLFLHSDTIPAPGFAERVRDALKQPGVIAGAFSVAIDGKGIGLRVLERLINFRARTFQMPYGDQGLFMTAETFFSVGPFPSQPIMEDFELVRRLRRNGRIKILPLTATTSARRWEQSGLLRTTLRNQAIITGYLLGVSPEKLAVRYRR